jgi:hypothetical protein
VEYKGLPLRPRPHTDDESLLGYILRLTQHNVYSTSSRITRLAGLGYIGHRCNFATDDDTHLDALASLARRSVEELRSLLYLSTDGSNGKFTDRLFFGQAIPSYALRVRKPKICPVCVAGELGYCRRVWDLAAVTICPIHRCLLIDQCPGCGSRISWVRSEIGRCPAKVCGLYWPDAPLPALVDEEMELTRHIHRLCGLLDDPMPEVIASTPLAGLGLTDLLSALFFVASQLDGIMDTKGKHFVHSRQNQKLHDLFVKALLVFAEWPKNFFAFLDKRRAERGPHESMPGWMRYFGDYKNALYVQLAGTQFDFLRYGFREYILAKRREALSATLVSHPVPKPRIFKQQILKQPLFDPEYMSGSDARRTLGTDMVGLKRLFSAGIVRGSISQQAGKNVYLT